MNASGYKSRTLATWIAVIGGSLGLHRFYLRGLGDPWGWLHVPATLAGMVGVARMRQFGVDDQTAWLLIPLLGLSMSAAMLAAIVSGLTPDERWNARYNPDGPQHQGGWGAILGVVFALVTGGGVLMATLAFSAQRYFEYQAERAEARSDGAAQTNSARPTQ